MARDLVAAIPIPVAATTTGKVVSGISALVAGWSLAETTGTAQATAELYDGQDTTGQLVAVIDLGAGSSETDAPAMPVSCRVGVYLNVVSGSVRGSVWVAPVGG